MASWRGAASRDSGRFSNKMEKLKNKIKFPPEFKSRVDISKVAMEVIRPWVEKKCGDILGFDDDVVPNLIINLLTANKFPDPRTIQIEVTGFLEREAGPFCKELWGMLLSANQNPYGIPGSIHEQAKNELLSRHIDRTTRERKLIQRQDQSQQRSRNRVQQALKPEPADERQDSKREVKAEPDTLVKREVKDRAAQIVAQQLRSAASNYRKKNPVKREERPSRGPMGNRRDDLRNRRQPQTQAQPQRKSSVSASPSPPACLRKRSRDRETKRSGRHRRNRTRSRDRKSKRKKKRRRQSASPAPPQEIKEESGSSSDSSGSS